jgi:hypothetical protein
MSQIDKIRACIYATNPAKEDEALAALAELETELTALRTRLAAIDAAPTVATIDQGEEGPPFADLALEFETCARSITIGTELIARPEAK